MQRPPLLPLTVVWFMLAATCSSSAQQQPATYARFAPERSDDFAWENDLVAFRTYGPALRSGAEDSGIDCWLKRVPTPIIDKWYAQEKRGLSYHQDHGEGYAPYHVGSSRGCGGLGLWRDGALITSDTYLAWRILESTRERSVFELDYAYPASTGGAPVLETKRITIRLGEQVFWVEARFTRSGQPLAGLPIAIGVSTQNGRGHALLNARRRWVAVWDKIDGFGLGTGAALAPGFSAEVREITTIEKDTNHALLITLTNAAGVVSYATGYGWEKAGEIRTPEQWTELLDSLSFP